MLGRHRRVPLRKDRTTGNVALFGPPLPVKRYYRPSVLLATCAPISCKINGFYAVYRINYISYFCDSQLAKNVFHKRDAVYVCRRFLSILKANSIGGKMERAFLTIGSGIRTPCASYRLTPLSGQRCQISV